MVNTNKTLFQRLLNEKPAEIHHLSSPAKNYIVKIVIFFVTISLFTFFFSIHFFKTSNEIRLFYIVPGYIWPNQSVVADFTFPIFKDNDVYENEKKDARKNSFQVFILNRANETPAFNLLDSIGENLRKYENKLKSLKTKNSDVLDELQAENPIYQILEQPSSLNYSDFKQIDKVLKKYIISVYNSGFIDVPVKNINMSEISVRVSTNIEKIIPTSIVIDSAAFIRNANEEFDNYLNSEQIDLAQKLLPRLIHPNLVFSKELTDKSRELAEQSVARTNGIVHEGETIVEKGEKITEESLRKLISFEHSKYSKSEANFSIWMVIGSLIHSILIYSILILYLFYIRKRIYYNNIFLIILSAILVFVAFLSWLSVQINTTFPIEYFIMIPGLAMLVAILFDSRTAFYATVTMALILAGIRGNDYDVGIAMLIAGSFAAYSVRDIQSRTQVFRAMLFIIIGLIFPILAFSFERSADSSQTIYRIMIAMLNSTISPLLTFGLLFFVEKLTNISTDLKLQEYNNLNHPLIQKLSEIAPGTYQHTLSVGILAERCATAIGANALLVRVGAFYHDIGKMAKPEYYAENQINIENKHDLIPPKKSAEAIKIHVTEGLKLAKQYKLPQRIIDFIPMHHGTSIIKHFYAKAKELAGNNPVNDLDFRYPGPKPNSKETAIVMICDACEAISRLNYKDKEQFEIAIDKIIKDKLLDGQFDDCQLTMKDLTVIKETCIKNLMGITHKRVEYKNLPDDDFIKK